MQTVQELSELILWGGERQRIERRVREGLYPELVEYIDLIQKAVVLCARGKFDEIVDVPGRESEAGMHVVMFDLEEFVDARYMAPMN